jgi:hypothetical protein
VRRELAALVLLSVLFFSFVAAGFGEGLTGGARQTYLMGGTTGVVFDEIYIINGLTP